jgi:hypothetical protein
MESREGSRPNGFAAEAASALMLKRAHRKLERGNELLRAERRRGLMLMVAVVVMSKELGLGR